MPALRDYQTAAVEGARAHVRELLASTGLSPGPAILLVMPTGAGKTVTFAEATRTALLRGTRVLIVAHRRELLRQAGAKLADIGIRHGFLAPGFPSDPGALVQIASVALAARALKKDPADPRFIGYGLLHIDEAHHTPAPGYLAIIAANPRAVVLGWTASPQRLDGRGLGRAAGGAYDRLYVGPSIAELTTLKHLCPARVFAPPGGGPDLKGVGRRGGDFAAGDLEKRMLAPQLVGDAVDHYRKLADGKPALAFCVSVAHAKAVAEAFRVAGYRAIAVSGDTDDDVRDTAMAGLADGSVQILCTCDLVSEGLDVPAVEVAILLRPTESLVLHVQQVGRILRVAPGKPYALVLDHAGNTARHGMPDHLHAWSLTGRQKRDKSAPTTKQCPSCYAIHSPAPTCVSCGHVYAVEAKRARTMRVVAGELVEVSATVADKLDREAAVEASRVRLEAYHPVERQSRCRTYVDYVALGQLKGFKPSWAALAYKDFLRARQVLGASSPSGKRNGVVLAQGGRPHVTPGPGIQNSEPRIACPERWITKPESVARAPATVPAPQNTVKPRSFTPNVPWLMGPNAMKQIGSTPFRPTAPLRSAPHLSSK